MRILAFLLFFQSFAACQQGTDISLPVEASIASSFQAIHWQAPNKALPADQVYRSTDGGQTWQGAGSGLPVGYKAGGIFSTGGKVYLVSENGMYQSTAATAAPLWEKAVFLEDHITGIFPGRAGTYALSMWNGLYQEILPGIWSAAHTPLKDKSVRSVLETPDGAVFVACDAGIFKSGHNGHCWKHVFQEGMVLNMVESGGVLVAAGFKGLLRSTDGGEHWNWVLTEGGVGIETTRIASGIAAITYNGKMETRRVRTSADNGKTWQPIDAGLLPSPSISSVQQAGEYLLCSHPAGIYRSADQGKTWELILPASEGMMFEFAVSGNVIYAVRAPVDGC